MAQNDSPIPIHGASTFMKMLRGNWNDVFCSIPKCEILHSVPKTTELFLHSFEPVVKTVRVQINAIRFICLRLMIERSKSESLGDVSVTRIDDTLSYGFLQTVQRKWIDSKLRKTKSSR